MISFKALAAATLLCATAATPAFAQDRALYITDIIRRTTSIRTAL